MDLTALAKQIGVTTAKLQSAMQASRPQAGAGRPDDMAAKLAKELGLSESKVKDALDELMPQRGYTTELHLVVEATPDSRWRRSAGAGAFQAAKWRQGAGKART
jgi:hypothetical protein